MHMLPGGGNVLFSPPEQLAACTYQYIAVYLSGFTLQLSRVTHVYCEFPSEHYKLQRAQHT